MHRRSFAVISLAFLVTGCGGTPNLDRMEQDVDRLTKVLPVLESMRVEEFRDSGWCRTLAVDGARYLESDSDNCFLWDGDGDKFDDAGELAFSRVNDALRDAGVPVYWLTVTYADDGTVAEAAFIFDTGFVIPFDGEHRYVYDVLPPTPRNGEVDNVAIDPRWQLQVDDWN